MSDLLPTPTAPPSPPLRATKRATSTSASPPSQNAAPPGNHWTQLAHDALPLGVITVDLDGRITTLNVCAQSLCDQHDPALGQHWTDVLTLSTDAPHGDPVKKTLGTGQPIHHWLTDAIDAHGHRIPVAVDTVLLKNSSGKIIGCLVTLRDLRHTETPLPSQTRSHTFEGIIGTSPPMRRVFDRLPVFAQSDSTVLIEGASGTGKELAARALHRLSPRRRQNFVALNCGALPDTLLESELFGYKRGAFTDAHRDKPGRFAAAEGGTLFLDEIGDISPAMQVRLLRVLQERVYEPLGSVTPIRTNVRIVVATHHDLHELVRQGRFRDDLLYRIDVIRLQLPALLDRREDIPLLVKHFIQHFNQSQHKDVAAVSPSALRVLLAHDYPGNVRELENIIEHAFVLISDGMIQPEHLPPWLGPRTPPPPPPPAPTPGSALGNNPGNLPGENTTTHAGLTLAQLEHLAIDDALLRHQGHRRAAAAELGINPAPSSENSKPATNPRRNPPPHFFPQAASHS